MWGLGGEIRTWEQWDFGKKEHGDKETQGYGEKGKMCIYLVLITANQYLTENLGPNGRISRRPQKLFTITSYKFF